MDVVSTVVGGLGTLALFFGGIVVRGLRSDITALEKAVAKIDKNVAIVLDRDRRGHRQQDREEENGQESS